MERLDKNSKDNNVDLSSLEKRQDTDAFSFCSEHHKKILLEKSNELSGTDIKTSLLQKIKYPETLFLNGNIVLNDGLNDNSGGILYAENIKLLPPDKKNSFYNVLGIKKRLFEISITVTGIGTLDITNTLTDSNVYIFQSDSTKIGEVIDISDNDSSFWIELYESDTILKKSDSIIFSSLDTYSATANENKKEAFISAIKDADYTDIPMFKPIILQSKLDSLEKPTLDISGGDIKVNHIISNDAKINRLETNNLYIKKFNSGSVKFEYNGGNQITGITDISAETMEVDNLILDGELELTGKMTYITSNNLKIADNIVHLNVKNSTLIKYNIDSGISINRGTDVSNVFIGWKESADTFIFGKTDSSGSTDTISDISICTIQADISGTIKTTRQEKITELPKLEKVGSLIGGSLGKGFGTIDISSNISTTTKISAPTIEAIGTGETRGLSGEVITTTQKYITKLPSLTGVGSLIDGSLNKGFGPIDLVGEDEASGKSKITARIIKATGTGGTGGTGGFNGNVITTTQNHITKIPNLTTVGDLSSGTIIEGFGPINLNIHITALTIEATGTGGTGGLSGEVITSNQPYITELPQLNTVGDLSMGSIDCSLNKGFGDINLGITDKSKSVITAKNINSDVNVINYNENIDISGGIVSNDISTNSVLLTGILDISNGIGFKLDDNIIKFKTKDVGWKPINILSLGDIILNATNELYNALSIVQNLTVVGPTTENDIKLDISWNKPLFSNNLHDIVTDPDNEITYKIELSTDPLFKIIDFSYNDVSNVLNVNITLDTNNSPGIRCTGYYVRIKAKKSDGIWGEYNVFQDTPGYPKMVSAGDNCYDYETKEKWIALPDYYKERIETIMFFKSTTIPENALNQDLSKNDLPMPYEDNFTIEISGNITDISENAFSGLSTLTKVIFNASTTPLNIGAKAFYDCVDLSFVDIYRKWQPSDLSNYDNIFGLEYPGSGTQLTLTYNEGIDSSFKFNLVGDISASKLFTNRNGINNNVIINLYYNDSFIEKLLPASQHSLTLPNISFEWAPTLTLRNFADPTLNSHKFNATSTKVGKIYYMVSSDTSTSPSVDSIKSATGSEGGEVDAPIATSDVLITLTELLPDTSYRMYAVAEDIAGKVGAIQNSIVFTTLTYPPGHTQERPAVNGKEIHAAGEASGWYWIQTSLMDSAKLVYINNDDEGGGWMLITYESDVMVTANGVSYPNDFVPASNPDVGGWSTKTLSCDVYKLWYHGGNPNVSENLHMWDNAAARVPKLTSIGASSRVVWNNPENFREAPLYPYGTVNTGLSLDGIWNNVKGRGNLGINLLVKAPCDWLYQGGIGYWLPCNSTKDTSSQGRGGDGLDTGMWMHSRSTGFYGGLNVKEGSARNPNCSTFALYIR